jgi:hypothetical protein
VPFDWTFALLFPVAWAGGTVLFAVVSGWRSLAEAYRFDGAFDGQRWGWKSATVGSVNYDSCLTFGAARDGLYIRPHWLFRLGHAPLFIPWSDVQVAEAQGWVFRYFDLRFAHAPEVRVRVGERLGTMLLSAGGRDVPERSKVVA